MNELRAVVAFAIEQAMPTRALGVLYADQQSDCGPLADAAIAAVLDHLIAEAENTLPWQLVVPQNDFNTDVSGNVADWLRSIREAGQ